MNTSQSTEGDSFSGIIFEVFVLYLDLIALFYPFYIVRDWQDICSKQYLGNTCLEQHFSANAQLTFRLQNLLWGLSSAL